MPLHLKHLTPLSAVISAVFAGQAYGAGFAIIENSASGTGVAYAGAAASAFDASVVWFNPAAMTQFDTKTVTAAAHVINVSSGFKNRGTSLNPQLGGGDIEGTTESSPHTGFIPNLYYIAPISSQMTFGLGINVPYGLETSYDKDWVGRYQAVDSSVMSINLNPSLAWELDEKFSLGVGISVQYLEATLSNAIDTGSICLATAPNNAGRAQCISAGLTPGNLERDGFGEVSGDSWSFSFNAGLLYSLTPQTQLGVAYRSSISHELEGTADFDNDPTFQQFLAASGSNAFTNVDVKADADLPATLSLSLSHVLNDKIQLLADATWTGWSSFEELRVRYDNPDQPDSVTTENWDDVIRYSLGAVYRHSDIWTYRAGVAFDEEPIPNEQFRTPRIPGNDRTWVALGLGYRINANTEFNIGYAHLFVDETAIDHTDESLGHTTRGLYEPAVDILSAQLDWKFD